MKAVLLVLIVFCFGFLGLSVRVPSLEQMSRLELIQSYCSVEPSELIDFSKFNHVLVEPKHKLVYCYVPKVACTNWKRIMYVLSGKSNTSDIPASLVHENGTLTSINQLNQNETINILEKYIKLIVVRHPFERLLSAYRNKLEGHLPSAKYFQARIGRYIIKKYRKNPSNISLETGADVSFREFVQYLINEGLNNEHWKPIHEICEPCLINYTYVIKYEYLIEEAEILLDLIEAKNMDFPPTKVSKTNQRLRRYYQELSLDEIDALRRLYQRDFLLFGYNLNDILGFDLG